MITVSFGSDSLVPMPSMIKWTLIKFEMNIKPIKTKKDYNQAIARLEKIFDAKTDTPEGNELEVLGILIDKYELTHFPIDFPDPIEAIKFRMEQLGYNQADLVNVLGFKSRVSEILAKKRKLSLDMIRKLNSSLNIPTEVLIKEY